MHLNFFTHSSFFLLYEKKLIMKEKMEEAATPNRPLLLYSKLMNAFASKEIYYTKTG